MHSSFSFYTNSTVMKRMTLYMFLLAAGLSSCTSQQHTQETKSAPEFIRVSQKDPRYFETVDGRPWIPVMINFIMPNGKEDEVFRKVETYFRNFSGNGGNAMRIWISSPFLEIEDEKTGTYDPVKFKRIDSVLSLAKKYGIQVKFTLQHIRTIQPVAPPGFGWANRSFLSVEEGGPFKNIQDYVSTPEGKRSYLDRARALAERYKDNRQIFGWELWNEMNALNAKWYPFTVEMLDSVKRLFPHQLIAQTLGSLFNQQGVDDYEKLLTIGNDEYITVHRYLDMGTKFGQWPIVRAPIDLLVADAIHTVYKPQALKPVLFNEIGATAPDFTGPSELYEIDTAGVLAHDMIFAPFFCGAAGSGSMWYWDAYVQKNNLWYHYQRFDRAIAGINPIEEQFVPFQFTEDSVRCYGLKGKRTTMIWCRDAANNWQTELQQHIQPVVKKDFSFSLDETGNTTYTSAEIYDPWKDKWMKAQIKNNRVALPPFLRSVVVVLKNE